MNTKSSDEASSDLRSKLKKGDAMPTSSIHGVSSFAVRAEAVSRKRSHSDFSDDDKNPYSPSQAKQDCSAAQNGSVSEPGESSCQKKESEAMSVKPSTVGFKTFEINDVISGRGGGTNRHEGNRFFRVLIESNRERYLRAKKNDKPGISMSIVRIIRERNGRFLRKNEKSNLWFEIGDAEAREKTSQALRQRAPEYKRKMIEREARVQEASVLSQISTVPCLQKAPQQHYSQLQQPPQQLQTEQLELHQREIQQLQLRLSQHQRQNSVQGQLEHQLNYQQMQIQQLQLQLMRAQQLRQQPVIPSLLNPSLNHLHQLLINRNPHQSMIPPSLSVPQNIFSNQNNLDLIPLRQIQLQDGDRQQQQQEEISQLQKRRKLKKQQPKKK